MNKIILLLVLNFIISSCNFSKKDSHLEIYGLKGNVKMSKTIAYSAKDKFGEPTKVSKIKYQSDYPESRFIFNEAGNIETEDYYNTTGNLKRKYKYRYDKNDKVTEILEYDEKGKLIGKSSIIYNEDKNLKIIDHFDNGGNLKFKQKNKYNENNEKIESSIFDINGDLIVRTEDSYEDGNRKVSTTYGSDGKMDYWYIFEYDKFGNELTANVFDENNMLSDKMTYLYTYDDENNWIEKVEFIDDNPKVIVQREIQYQ